MANVVVRVIALVWLGACGFQPGTAAQIGSGQIDGAVDAPADAKVWMDAPPMGHLTVTPMTMTGDIDVTAEGTLDWAHWGYASSTDFNHKNGANIIGNLTAAAGGRFTGSPMTTSWSDGTPTPSVTATTHGVWIASPSTLTFTVPANTTPHTLRVYVMVQEVDARLDVSLSDSSAPPQQVTRSTPGGTTNGQFTIVFNAAGDGQTLTVSWTDTHDYSGTPLMGLLSATLQ